MRESVINQQVEEIFSQLLKNLKDKVPSAFFDSMFDNDSFVLKSLSNNKALFICDSESNALMLNKAYKSTISDYLNNITQSNYEVEIIDNNTYKKRKVSDTDLEITSSFFKNSHLSPSQTFDSFVIGESNKNAYQAALFSVEKPGITNPIFIHSKSGLGKTHLLNAIGNEVKRSKPNASVLFISSDDFISEYVKYTLGAKGADELKNFFSSVDYLLVDDIQLFSGKSGTQDFFFNVFNLLVNNNKQIIITSDKSPSELEELGDDNIQDRLVSRFKGGLTLSISSPNKNTLVEILKMKMKNNNLEEDFFSDEVCLYLANSFSKNVRVLEGAFITLLFNITANKITKENITLDYVKSVFESEEQNKSKKEKLTIDTVIDIVSSYYSLSINQIKSKIRTSQIALARQIAMYLTREVLSVPYQEIGRYFNKDHSTVLSNCKKIEEIRKKDEVLNKVLLNLKEKINNKKV